MINSKSDLYECLRADRAAQPPSSNFLKRRYDRIYLLKTLLRKCEYYHNTMKNNPLHKLIYIFMKLRLNHVEHTFCSEIPINVFGKGLVIWHAERIIVNPNAIVGEHCSLSSGVVIAHAHNKNPIIGNNVELMIDSCVLGGITVADHVRIGAKALVLKDISDPNTTWGGVPAKKLNNCGTLETPIPGGVSEYLIR